MKVLNSYQKGKEENICQEEEQAADMEAAPVVRAAAREAQAVDSEAAREVREAQEADSEVVREALRPHVEDGEGIIRAEGAAASRSAV